MGVDISSTRDVLLEKQVSIKMAWPCDESRPNQVSNSPGVFRCYYSPPPSDRDLRQGLSALVEVYAMLDFLESSGIAYLFFSTHNFPLTICTRLLKDQRRYCR